jgi:hypothetical protein
MNRWQVATVLAVVAVAVALIGVAGSRVMTRDRLRIYDDLAQARMQRLEVRLRDIGKRRLHFAKPRLDRRNIGNADVGDRSVDLGQALLQRRKIRRADCADGG